MRDPATNTILAEALEETRIVLRSCYGFGVLRKGTDDPDYYIRAKTRIELTLESAKVEYERRLPDDVHRYLSWLVADDLRVRPHGKVGYTSRNSFIASTIKHLEEKFGIKPTRNRDRHESKNDLSGCAIVKQIGELRMAKGEAAIEKIWEEFQDCARSSDLPKPIELSPEARRAIDEKLKRLENELKRPVQKKQPRKTRTVRKK